MRLRQLTGLEQDKLRNEHAELMGKIADLKAILASEEMRMDIIKEELVGLRDKFGDDRRSQIDFAGGNFRIEDIIPNKEVVVTISHLGYIKRTELTEYRQQSRGGVGAKGSSTRDKDFLEHIFVSRNHNWLLIFTEKGKCFWMRVFDIPEGAKATKGRPIQNLINLDRDDKVMAYINVADLTDEEYINNNYILMCTKQGIIKKTSLEAYSRPRQNGINAITIREDDELLEAKLTSGSSEIMIAASGGKSIRFNETDARPMGRNASGVRGIKLEEGQHVVGMIAVEDVNTTVLVISENGYGKRTSVEDYRKTNRGGKGVKTINITEKTGSLIAIKNVDESNDLMIINKSGIAIRISVEELRVMGRNTQGVKVINLRKNDQIAGVAKVPAPSEEEKAAEAAALENEGEAPTPENNSEE
jgi:DNA gyrase subunit A